MAAEKEGLATVMVRKRKDVMACGVRDRKGRTRKRRKSRAEEEIGRASVIIW